MTKLKQLSFPYSRFDKYCIRTPILPINYYYELTADERISEDFLKIQWDNKLIREAIYLASPDLYYQLDYYIENRLWNNIKWRKLKQTFTKYLIRMSTRSTPFGLFAGCSTGEFQKSANIKLAGIGEGKRVTNLDMHFLVRFADLLKTKKRIKTKLIYYPNSSIYKLGNYYRYIEYSYENNSRIHTLESIKHSKYLENLLQFTKAGKTFKELVNQLSGMKISNNSAKSFVEGLIQNQLLISNLEARVSGQGYLEDLILELKRIDAPTTYIDSCLFFKKHLSRIDMKIGQSKEEYEELIDYLSSKNISYDKRYLFQLDFYPNLKKSSLSHSLVRKVKNGIKVLKRISVGNTNENLEKFKERFYERYESQRIPLLLALDIEAGIGYGPNLNVVNSTTMLGELRLERTTNGEKNLNFSISPFIKSLLPKIQVAHRTGEIVIDLNDNDINQHDLEWASSPSTLATMVEIIELNGCSKVILNYCGGNAAKLLARFGNGNSEIASLIENIIKKESKTNNDVILAEIIHLPKERTGNILRRPNYRKYEIPYLASSSVSFDNQIPLQDLDLQIQKNTIKLLSKSRDAEIIPKLTNAHNFETSNTPVYHFLCDLQYQHNDSFGFDWGSMRMMFDFLPRLEYRSLIISKAQWKITKEEMRNVLGKNLPGELKKINEWRNMRNLPDQVQLLEGDNKLCVNFFNHDSIDILVSVLDQKSTVWVEEFYFSPGNCLVTGENGCHTSEFIIPFYLS